MTASVMWFRRDLRLADNPALLAAARDGRGVVALFVVDSRLLDSSVRSRRLAASLEALDASLGGQLVVRAGDPVQVVAQVAAEVGADEVHISADCAPYGRRRDGDVAAALASQGRQLVATGSPYAITPGRVTKPDGTAYRVFTPFYRAWLAHGWRAPAGAAPPHDVAWLSVPGEGTQWLTQRVAASAGPMPTEGLPPAGEQAARDAWDRFRSGPLANYATDRDRPDLVGTSGLSAALRFGEIHPRTLLADLATDAGGEGAEAYRRELAFRDFYADVLWHNPASAHASGDTRFDTHMQYNTGPQAQRAFRAWCDGRTGYPFVDAGMRQLQAEGWIHNRVRMVVASFLVKDLHLPWWRGAEWFMTWLRDGDLASNSAGWQWVAGCGTDAAPYHRVFNPVTQGKKFDPTGAYVRRYLPELAGLAGIGAHEPWKQPLLAGDYPAPIVDHGTERLTALERHNAMKAAAAS